MDSFDLIPNGPDKNLYSIDFLKVLEDDRFSALTKATVRTLMRHPYMQLGDFFKNLSSNDVAVLSIMVELSKTDDDILSDLLILTEVLSRAEGADPVCAQDTYENLNYFCTLITCESLCRKGLVDIKYENMSFGRDVQEEVVMLRKQPE